MAATTHQLWGHHNYGSVISSEDKDWRCQHKHKKSRPTSYELPWEQYFRDSSRWWDNRSSKVGPAYPDFQHKVTKEFLWVDCFYNPSWVVEELRSKGVVASTHGTSLSTHAQHREPHERNEMVVHDKASLCKDEATAFVALLRSCAKNKDLYRGAKLHDDILKRGLLEKCSDALVTLYAKCGVLSKAQELLDMHKSMDVFSWTALIAGYARQGRSQDALKCFERMQREGLSPNAVTFACILKACGTMKAIEKGKQIHEEIARQGLLGNDVVLGTALVDMYSKCGVLETARHVLEELPSRNVVSWSALIAGYAQQGQGEQALNCFEQMKCDGISPDGVTFACILKACGSIKAADKGEIIHEQIAKQGLLRKDVVLGNALVDMYAKCGELTKAHRVLEELPSRDVFSWSALIAGYAHEGQGEQALSCFECMQREGFSPDAVTFACILKACGTIGAADKGEQIHDEIERQGLLRNNIVLGTALVDMYANCGALAKAQQVLEGLPSRDVVSWNALIARYTQQGQGEQALKCFELMQQEGFTPDAVTFSCVLNACNHLGLVEGGYMYFVNMSTKYGVKPNLEHYTCMVDLFGRVGHLEKAVSVIQEMPSSDYAGVWRALLSACVKWGDLNIGRWAFEQAVHVDKTDGAAYALMVNIYAAAGMQEDAEIIEAMRMENEAWKKPGLCSWIDVGGKVHAFSVGDTEHAQHKYIDGKLEDIAHKMSQEGYSFGLHWVSPNVADIAKKHLQS